jgi:hypothetical protein
MGEQFSEPAANVIESTEGFSVKVLGRTGMRYTEGTRSVWIDSAFDWASVALCPPNERHN